MENEDEDDDDLSGELSRLSQIERNLSRELNRYRWLQHKNSASESALRDYYVKRKDVHRDEMLSIATELRRGMMLAVRRRQCSYSKAFVRSRFLNDEVGKKDRDRLMTALSLIRIRKAREKESKDYRGVFAKVADVAFFGGCDDSTEGGCVDGRIGDGELFRSKEGMICVLMSTCIATAYAFDRNSPHHVLLLLFLPSLLILFVSKYPFNDEKIVFVVSIIYLCHCKRLSLKESVD